MNRRCASVLMMPLHPVMQRYLTPNPQRDVHPGKTRHEDPAHFMSIPKDFASNR